VTSPAAELDGKGGGTKREEGEARMADAADVRQSGSELNRLLLAGVLVVTAFLVLLLISLYLLPAQRLQIPELQPTIRVARVADFPVGTGRVVSWGARVVLVVRRSAETYYAVQGTAPSDGCLLKWDEQGLQIVSPCTHLVYDLHGTVVTGLSTVPLRRYGVFVHGDVVYVKEAP
jgi:nitrite reductase/ring-hydroxylating ferredoxin subunit